MRSVGRSFLSQQFTLAVLSTMFLLGGEGQGADARKPNVVVLVADDLGYGDLGFQGGKDIPTPNLDAFARQGVRCTNGYVSGPYCSPTRAGLLTGRYQQRFGHEFNPAGQGTGLPLSETTIANRLKALGYDTGLVGKWHLGGESAYQPPKRGFDEFFGFLGGSHTYFTGMSRDIYRGTKSGNEPEYLTDAFRREAIAFIDRHKSRPFFLEVTFNAVHTPMNATDARLKRFEHIEDKTRRTYAAMLVAMDEAIGAILDKLKAERLDEQTLVVFFSDNGGPTMLGTTRNGSSNLPLRGSKRTTLEGGIRVPFVFRWPGTLPANSVYEHPIIQLDILPTVLAMAGAEPKPSDSLDGVNLIPYLSGKNSGRPHETLYWRFGEQMAIRQGDWKLVRYDSAIDSKVERSSAANVKPTPPRLYNLGQDLHESHDLAAEQPEKVRGLEAAWNTWNSTLKPPLWGPAGNRVQAKR